MGKLIELVSILMRCLFSAHVLITLFVLVMLGSSLPPVVCRRAHVLLTLFVLLMLGSSLPLVVCRRAHVLITLFVLLMLGRLYLQLFVGGLTC
jgi:hypothetical protein